MDRDQLPDFNLLSAEELQDEYLKLYERFQQLREQSETDAQCIHELKRNLDTATAAESYLAQELEQLTLTQDITEQSELGKSKTELEQTRKKNNELVAELVNSQQETELVQMENVDLRRQLEEQLQQRKAADPIDSTGAQLEREQQLQQENSELLQKLEEFQESTTNYIISLAKHEKAVEILQDQVNCLEENMQYKRDELEELTQLLESTQEQLMEAKAKIAMLTAAPDNIDRKGNSLFAEVDDQRQSMKKLLAAQKKSYLEMKKIYNDSEHEIRRLKRENMAMHTELQTCSALFCNADRTYQEKLKGRILQLLNQKEELEKQLNCTQKRLSELANNKGVAWINSILNFCKQETDELKKQLHSERFQMGTLEEQLRNSQQEMARWRFESLKSRCILLDRENLLTENKITFKPNSAIEFHVSEKQLQSSRPRISISSTVNKSSSTPEIKKEENLLKEVKNNSKEIQSTSGIPTTISTQVGESLETKKVENKSFIDLTKPAISISDAENKENLCEIVNLCNAVDYANANDGAVAKNVGTLHVRDIAELQSTPFNTKKSQSILCKDPFGKETKKTVKFSNNEFDSDKSNGSHIDENSSSGKATIKQMRTKSNVIVKRIIVSSRNKP